MQLLLQTRRLTGGAQDTFPVLDDYINSSSNACIISVTPQLYELKFYLVASSNKFLQGQLIAFVEQSAPSASIPPVELKCVTRSLHAFVLFLFKYSSGKSKEEA